MGVGDLSCFARNVRSPGEESSVAPVEIEPFRRSRPRSRSAIKRGRNGSGATRSVVENGWLHRHCRYGIGQERSRSFGSDQGLALRSLRPFTDDGASTSISLGHSMSGTHGQRRRRRVVILASHSCETVRTSVDLLRSSTMISTRSYLDSGERFDGEAVPISLGWDGYARSQGPAQAYPHTEMDAFNSSPTTGPGYSDLESAINEWRWATS